jgi:cysteine/O-acetylserine efflux protein
VNWFAFLSFVFVVIFTPGPNNVTSTAIGLNYGYRKALPFIFGACTGALIVISISALLVEQAFGLTLQIETSLRILGCIYMIWLAYKIVKSNPDKTGEKKTGFAFYHGLLLQFVNIKAILFGIVINSVFIIPNVNSIFEIIYFFIFLTILAFTSMTLWALFGTIIQRALGNATLKNLFNYIMAALLVFIAISILNIPELIQ